MKKFISGNCYLNNLKCFWNIWPWWPWPLTPKSIRLLPNMHVLTKSDEGRSRCSRVIDWNEKVTDGQTDRQSNNIMPSFLWRGHKKNVIWWSLLVVGIVITTRYIYIYMYVLSILQELDMPLNKHLYTISENISLAKCYMNGGIFMACQWFKEQNAAQANVHSLLVQLYTWTQQQLGSFNYHTMISIADRETMW